MAKVDKFWQSLAINRNVKKHKPDRVGNVIMFHAARCGSTVLADMFRQHKHIRWFNEVFNKNNFFYKEFGGGRKRVKTALNYHLYRKPSQWVGFEVTFSVNQQIGVEIRMELEDFIALAKEVGVSHFIILERSNLLRRSVSAHLAERNRYHTKEEVKKVSTVPINVKSFQFGAKQFPLIDHFKNIEDEYRRLNELLQDDQCLTINYEKDILPDPLIAYEKICDFLNIEDQDPDIRYKRTNPFPLNEVIENFKEVEDLLKGTKYEWMLWD